MSASWLVAGLLSGPPLARIEMFYETEPSGYRAHWTFDEIRPGTLPGLSIRGPKEEAQMLFLSFNIHEEGFVVFDVRVTDDREVDGSLQTVDILRPTLMTPWNEEATIVTHQRERLRRFGRDRWLDVRVELRLTASPVEPNEAIPDAP